MLDVLDVRDAAPAAAVCTLCLTDSPVGKLLGSISDMLKAAHVVLDLLASNAESGAYQDGAGEVRCCQNLVRPVAWTGIP